MSVVPKNTVQILINDISSMQENNIRILKNYVLHCLNNTTCDSSSVLKITDMFDTLQNPFDKLKTEYMRMKTLKEIGVFIEPISNETVSSRYNNIVRNGLITIYYGEYRC